jgi:YVTN family beta-propeller protein
VSKKNRITLIFAVYFIGERCTGRGGGKKLFYVLVRRHMRFFPVFALILFSLTLLAFSQNPEQSVAPPGMIFELLALNHDLPTTARPTYLSPCDLVASADSKTIYVAEQTAKQIAVVDIATKAVVKTIKLPNEPTGIAVTPDGLLYVTCSSDQWPNGMVCEVHPVQGKVLRRLPAGHGARSPVLSHFGRTLYVCNQYENDVYIVDVAAGTLTSRIDALRQPYAAALTPDDSVLVVTSCLPNEKSTDTLKITSKILLIDAFAKKVRDTLPLPLGSNSVFGVTISPDGKYAFATHLVAMFGIPATKVDGGWIHTNNCAIVDIKKRSIKNDVTLDSPLQGSANPWGITCSPDGKLLCVVHAGSNELSIIDIQKLIGVADSGKYNPFAILLPHDDDPKTVLAHDFSALNDAMEKKVVKGKEPRAVTIVGNQLYTSGYFGDNLESFTLSIPGSGTKTPDGETISLGPEISKTSERKGQIAFGDAGLTFQKWNCCLSCHPFMRDDGLNRTLRNEFAAPKNIKTMIYAWWTPPTSWAGVRQNAFESIRAGQMNELFLEPDMETYTNMDTFFMKMKPVPSPYLVKGKLSASAQRGRNLFLSMPTLDCRKCHPIPLYTDLKFHNTGAEDPYDNSTSWDTPSLVECWRTAPYNHLGSKLTVYDMVRFQGMSSASKELTDYQISDLVEFVLSL